jgi:hypothetical protein
MICGMTLFGLPRRQAERTFMIPRAINRKIRPMWIAAVVTAAWANRADLCRWLGFVQRAVEQRHTRPVSDVLTEAKVRVVVSADPLLRRDPTLEDVTVDDGVVTLLTTAAPWPDSSRRIDRLKRVKGISEVSFGPVGSNAAD